MSRGHRAMKGDKHLEAPDRLTLREYCPQDIACLFHCFLRCGPTGNCVFDHQLYLDRDSSVLRYVPARARPVHQFRNSTREPSLLQVKCPSHGNACRATSGLHAESPHRLWADNPFQYRKRQWRHPRLAKDDIHHSTSNRCWHTIWSRRNGDAAYLVAEGFFAPP